MTGILDVETVLVSTKRWPVTELKIVLTGATKTITMLDAEVGNEHIRVVPSLILSRIELMELIKLV